MTENPQKPCAVFSTDEVRALRSVPTGMKIVVGLFVAIVVLIFVPFQTVTQLGQDVGTLAAVQSERRLFYEKQLDLQRERIKKVEESHASIQKRFYWIDRHSREANEKIDRLLRRLEGDDKLGKVLELSRRSAGLPSARK